MPSEAEESGFLSRWSRRKAMQRERAAPEESRAPVLPPAAAAVPPGATAPPSPAPAPAPTAAVAPASPGRADAAQSPAAEPPPSMDDVAMLTRESDFSRFVAPGVRPDVRNAALGKLFQDPHFNVMDRLDVYIDDYGRPDPLPPGMLRQMLQAHALGLFDGEKRTDDGETLVAAAAPPPPDPLPPPAAADAAALSQSPGTAPDEDTDLQLQPDDGAGRTGAEAGAGEDAGRPR